MRFAEVLKDIQSNTLNERFKGARFEVLIKYWLQTDPRYCDQLTDVWLWEEFPARKDLGGKDLGIDLVARTEMGEYWAVQCKCYAPGTVVTKQSVDSFVANANRSFADPETFQATSFSELFWVSTSERWNSAANETVKGQSKPFHRISRFDLQESPVDWEKLLEGVKGKSARLKGKQPRKHQIDAIVKAKEYYREHDRGKLIMACGTGKTYTSLKIIESQLGDKGLVLFMVPSIALLGQSLNAWFADASKEIKAVCVCSDSKASRMQADEDCVDDGAVDLAYPASTDPKVVARQLRNYRGHGGLVVVFSTYQSIDAIAAAQQEILKETDSEYGIFDFIVCDEAHRTTGARLTGADESDFTKIHSNGFVQGRKRLYMTATPRLYGESSKIKASKIDCVLCSMDDEALYGQEFFRVGFSYAVENGLLTDYKVLVLTVSEADLPANIREEAENKDKELNFDDATRLVGVINGLSKIIRGDNGVTWQTDPRMMRRGLVFCSQIRPSKKSSRLNDSIASVDFAAAMPVISQKYNEELSEEERKKVVHIKAKHIDGSMNAQDRDTILSWLKEEADDPQECRLVSNVRCLSEGVDVPALDAVVFLSPRNSQVDIVQSVGRVMRSFHKGLPDEKKYGYIIIPVVIPMGAKPEDVLSSNAFDNVWSILNALRSHDDNFNAFVNGISLNRDKTGGGKLQIGGPGFSPGSAGIGSERPNAGTESVTPTDQQIAAQLALSFGEMKKEIYAKLVEKCGDRNYWENWAKKVGVIARKLIARITQLSKEDKYQQYFADFVKSLQTNLNPSVTEAQSVEMLAQHMITHPIFDALFSDYKFVANNSISQSMQFMVDLLTEDAMDKDTEVLNTFYASARRDIGKIDNLEGKQKVIKDLYEKFFKGAFPKTVEQMGIVYTPIECVDFILHSVESVMKNEFDASLADSGVHILDPFTGTGTFITRLLQSGIIPKERLREKYLHEIHCNEIVLLSYYIADVNIESTYHELMKADEYLNYDGICLTDTFQLGENEADGIFKSFFKENAACVERQKHTPIRVIIGNPPYSVGQKSANDNAQNIEYPKLDRRVAETYAAKSKATLKTSLYDTYIKAFRWASDRISENKEGGIVAFISNGAWLDGNATEGFRRSIVKEFSSIYVFNLRGNQRTSGELSRKEGGKIFGSGARTPIAITILVKNPAHQGDATIHYCDIGDYLSREDKLKLISKYKGIESSLMKWQTITPNAKADWINQRDGVFDNLIILGNKDKKIAENTFFEPMFSNGVKTNRDTWCYNLSRTLLIKNIINSIDFYNSEVNRYSIATKQNSKINVADFVNADSTKFTWDRQQKESDIPKGRKYSFEESGIREACYRPFFKQFVYMNRQLNNCVYKIPSLFPTSDHGNLVICVCGVGVTKEFSCIITNHIPDLELIGKSQCFPLYWYKKNNNTERNLFSEVQDQYTRHDAITDWVLRQFRSRFHAGRQIDKEMIFYYVYGLLHSEDYRTRFSADLKKSLPRIPIVDSLQDFLAFEKAGRELADLHLNYESRKAPGCVTVIGDKPVESTADGSADYAYFAIPDKMSFAKNGKEKDKSTIIYNGNITIQHIPAEAYDYIVNGKSAVEWLMERYCVSIDKKSGIRNDANAWAREHRKPRYILDLLLSIMSVSVETLKVVRSLPRLTFK